MSNKRCIVEATATWAIHRACARVGLRRIGWHVLRHTFASRLVSEGVPLNEVMRLMGHSCITTTMRYAHFAPSKLHESIRVLEAAERRALAENFGQPAGNVV
ncbi:MAG: tyrosine-type recombinase/integrase [Patescibacteria group bacterium]|nr:tyrosine-type recombinase/integrase [Patescibacteria group bacterium]